MVDSDEELVRATRQGDREAFSRLVERYERAALVVAHSILHSWHDARDAVQDAFVAAFEQINRLWSPGKFGGWLLQIVRRQALLHYRRRTARTRALVALSTEPAHEPADESAHEGAMSVDAAALIARLPKQECVVVALRHLDELSVAEIAQITGRPVGTVTKQLSRAYARMRHWLEFER